MLTINGTINSFIYNKILFNIEIEIEKSVYKKINKKTLALIHHSVNDEILHFEIYSNIEL